MIAQARQSGRISHPTRGKAVQRWRSALLVAVVAAAFGTGGLASAADLSWSTTPSNGNYNNGSNWGGATVPGASDTGVFSSSSVTSLFLSAPTQVNDWRVVGPDSFTVNTNDQVLQFLGGGIAVQGGGVTINVTGNNSEVSFQNGSTSGSATINITAFDSVTYFGTGSDAGTSKITVDTGLLQFLGNGSAANATVTANTVGAAGASVTFFEQSTAGGAEITLNGALTSLIFQGGSTAENATIVANTGARITFEDDSRAGNSNITVTGPSGALRFIDNSTAENAVVTASKNAFVQFEGNAKAGNSRITLDSEPALFAVLGFFDNSAAENALITANGPNALVQFLGSASGGDARFIIHTGSTFSITNLATTGTTAGSIEGAGTFNLGDKTLTVGSNNLSTEVTGTIIGMGGSLTKVGNGTLTLSGANTYTGETVVQAGILEMNTSSHASHVRVDGGVLAGNGEFGVAIVGPGGLEVNAGGTVAPGPAAGGIGTLTANGSVAFQPGSHFRVDVNAAGQSDRLVAQFGAVNLTGAILDVMAANGKYAPSTSYLVIDNSGSDAVVGTFASLNSSLAFLTPTVSTTGGDGNDVVLTMTRNATVFRDVAATPNQAAVATALDQSPIDSPLVLALLNQTEPGARQAFDALSGEVHATVAGVLVNDSHFMRDAILARLVQAHHSVPGGTSFAALGAAGPTAVAASEGAAKMSLGMGPGESAAALRGSSLAFWSQGFGSWGSFDGDGNAAAADRTLGGFVSGVDGYLGGGWRAGIAVGYTQSDTRVDARLSQADIDSYHLAAYAGGRLGAFALRAGAAWAWHDVKTKRTIAFPGFLERAETSYDGDTGQVFGELALPFVAGKSALEPFAGLAYVHVSTDGFTENGGIAALTSRGTDQDVGYSRLGLRAAATMTFGGMHVVPYASAAWLHAFSDVTPDVALAFASPAAGFTISGVPVARDSAQLEAGLAIHLAPGATLGLSYQGQLGNDVEDHGVSGRFNWQF